MSTITIQASRFRSQEKLIRLMRVKSVFKNALRVLNKKERSRFSILIALDIGISILDIFSLALLLWIIRFYISGNSASSLVPQWMLAANPMVFIGLFFLFFSIKNLSAFFIAKAQYQFVGGVAVRISENGLSAFQNAIFEDFVTIDSSVFIRRLANQPFEYCQYILSGVQQIVTQSSLIIISTVAIIFFNAKLFFLLLLILLPPVIGVFHFIRRRLTKAKLNIQSSNQKSFQYLLDALKGYVEGNLYHRNNFFLKRFVDERRQFSWHLFDSLSIQMLPARLIEIFAVMGLLILILIAEWTGNGDQATFIAIGAFMAAAYKIIPGIVKIINISGQMKAYELPQLGREMEVNTGADGAAVEINTIRFEDISFRYSSLSVLNNLTFKIQRGDFVGITGSSGKGKTTLFNLLLGFLSPSGGQILINDEAVSRADQKNYWKNISYVRQQSFFIHDTLERNITLEEEVSDKERLDDVVAITGLYDFVKNSSEDLSKIITENGKNISGGQQQRIALARALYKNAPVILLDEPFSELDEASETALLKYFRALAGEGRIVIMITHHSKALDFCNKIISLDEP
jgi:ABC-type multidrug transport system fused ATPase/permease subunit